jgi:serine/threonine protein kinase
MTGFPIPDFDFDGGSDDCGTAGFSPASTSYYALSSHDLEAIFEASQLRFDPKHPKCCTSNSAVYHARAADGSSWAAKVTPHIRRAQEEAAKRLAIPASPFLVHTINVFVAASRALLQMEFCEIGDLNGIRASLPGKRFPEPIVWELINHIGNALLVVHMNGWIHLDVSPGNILRSDDMFKLADFGTLTPIDGFEEGNEGAGPYVSPEALDFPRGPFPVNSQTDIFSFGVVLLEVITGRLAPRGGSRSYSQLRRGLIGLGSRGYECDCSPRLATLVNQMLAGDPSQRPTSADLVALTSALAD